MALALSTILLVADRKTFFLEASAASGARSIAWGPLAFAAGFGLVILGSTVLYFLRGRTFPWAAVGTTCVCTAGAATALWRNGSAALFIVPLALFVLVPVASSVREYLVARRGEASTPAPTFWLGLYTLVVFLLVGLLTTILAAEDLKQATRTFSGLLAVSIFGGVAAWIGWSAFVFLSRSMRSFAYLLPAVLLALAPLGLLGFVVHKNGLPPRSDAYVLLAFGVFFVLWAVLLLLPLRRRSALAAVSDQSARSVALVRIPVLGAFVIVLGGGLGAVVLLNLYGVSQEPIAMSRATYTTNGSRSQVGRADTICWSADLRAGGLAQATVSFADGTSVVGYRASGQTGVEVEFEFPTGARRKLDLGEEGGRLLWPEAQLTQVRMRVFAPGTTNRFCLEKGQFLRKAPLLHP